MIQLREFQKSVWRDQDCIRMGSIHRIATIFKWAGYGSPDVGTLSVAAETVAAMATANRVGEGYIWNIHIYKCSVPSNIWTWECYNESGCR